MVHDGGSKKPWRRSSSWGWEVARATISSRWSTEGAYTYTWPSVSFRELGVPEQSDVEYAILDRERGYRIKGSTQRAWSSPGGGRRELANGVPNMY